MKIKASKTYPGNWKTPEIINFTINKLNVYNESNALATTNTTEQEKVGIVSKKMETTTGQEYTRLIINTIAKATT